ncbi:lipid phosphate phosphatase 1 [Agrocybe pediades]|nr:lipid phosphate phosphatase 1 [Agrocybe pediades]
MSRLRSLATRYFGQDALEWADRSYLVDWAAVILVWALSGLVSLSPVFERDFDLSDPLIHHPHKKNQVSSFVNQNVALFVPLLCFIVVGCVTRSLLLIHHGAIGLCASRGLARLITESLKHGIGRLRPDFLARCKWDTILKECQGHKHTILDGRKSFPSGHSSTAFSGMFFLSLWIAGQTAAWCFAAPKSPASLRSSRMCIFLLTLLPIFWAAHVAITRIQDYRHHKEDVIVGSLLGCLCAWVSYLMFWPNPMSLSSYRSGTMGQPRLLYVDEDRRPRAADFELSRLEADEENAV